MDPEVKAELIEQFTKELWPLNKAGNAEHAASELINAIAHESMFEGGPVTFEIIKEKYKEYLKLMKAINGERESRFQTKIEDIAQFIIRKKFNEDFKVSTDSNLDLYLYGD